MMSKISSWLGGFAIFFNICVAVIWAMDGHVIKGLVFAMWVVGFLILSFEYKDLRETNGRLKDHIRDLEGMVSWPASPALVVKEKEKK